MKGGINTFEVENLLATIVTPINVTADPPPLRRHSFSSPSPVPSLTFLHVPRPPPPLNLPVSSDVVTLDPSISPQSSIATGRLSPTPLGIDIQSALDLTPIKGQKKKRKGKRNNRPGTAPSSYIPAIPTPSSPEVLTMTKTLLSRGGISAPSLPSTAYHRKNDVVDLLDDQRIAVEKLKMRGGDSAAKKKFARLIKEKERMEGRSMEMGEWEEHLPRYARHKVAPPKPKQESYGEMVLRQLEEGGGQMLEGDKCYEPKHNKTRCGLCNLYFSTDSATGVISMKSVVGIQKTWGVKHTSKKYEKASFLYSKCKLCKFCSQMFNNRSRMARKFGKMHRHIDPEAKGHSDTIKDDIMAKVVLQERDLDNLKERNLAVAGRAAQSSTVDGKLPTLAITGKSGAQPMEMCTRTRREFESWWEVELYGIYPIKAIVIYNRKDGDGGGRAYRAAPYWAFITNEPLETARVSESKKQAVRAALVNTNEEKVTWKMAPNTVGRVVRIQCEGVKSLQLAQVEVIKGGIDSTKVGGEISEGERAKLSSTFSPTSNKNKPTVALTSMGPMTTFSFDFIGSPSMSKSLPVKQQHSARPSTAPDRQTSSFSRTTTRRCKVQKSTTESTEQVNKLFNATAASFQERNTYDEEIFTTLSKFNELEREAIKRNFLHFAEVQDVPRRSSRSPDFVVKLSMMVENTEISSEQAAAAVKALKQAGISGPKKKKKEVFGFWEKEEAPRDFTPNNSIEDSSVLNVSITSSKSKHKDEPLPQLAASQSYTSLVESYCIDDLLGALRDVEFSKEVMGVPPVRITFYEFLQIIECCSARNLQLLGKVFNVPTNQIRTNMGDSIGHNSLSLHRLHTSGGKERPKKPDPPPLSLSQSLKHYKDPSATYISSPIPMRKPKIMVTGKGRLQKSEESFNALLERYGVKKTTDEVQQNHTFLLRRLGADEPKLTGYEYVEEQDARRERMRQIHKETAVEPTIHPALNRKNCSLCLLSFPTDALVESATVKCLKEFSKLRGVTFEKFGLRVPDSSLLIQHRIPVCSFCSQFFNPDAENGLAATQYHKREKYEQYFDDFYPETYSDLIVPEMDNAHLQRVKRNTLSFAKEKMKASPYAASGMMQEAMKKKKQEEAAGMLRQQSLMNLEHYNQRDDSLIYGETRISGSIGTASIASEDRISLERTLGMTHDERDFMEDENVSKRIFGTIRDPGGRKDASTGFSVHQFAVARESDEINKKIRGDYFEGKDEANSEDISLTSSHLSLVRQTEEEKERKEAYDDHKDEVGKSGKDLWSGGGGSATSAF